MASRSPERIRNIVVCGHSTSGKTTLVEQLLSRGGAISRPGSIDDGNTVGDFDEQEKERKHSIDLACCHLESQDVLVQLLDTPGYRDFIGQFYCGVSVADLALVVVSADDGVQPTTRKIWEVADALHLPRFVVINRLDREHADFENTLTQVREQLSSKCAACSVPDASGSGFSSTRVLVGDSGDEASALMESIVETDDELMERYLGGEQVAEAELTRALSGAVASCQIFPVFATSATKGVGIEELLNHIVQYAPPASANSTGREVHLLESPEEKRPLSTSPGDPLCGQVFKVVSDPYLGKLSYVRLFSGSLATNGSFMNPHTGKMEKVGKLVRPQGKEQQTVEQVGAGEIVGLVKVEGLKIFDVISGDSKLGIEPPKVPAPMCGYAVSPKTKADEKKFAESFTKILDEDVTLRSVRDNRTGEFVVSGMSQLHLVVAWARLRSRYGVDVEATDPKIPYLETISAKGDDQYRHKKQTGGAGEFAEVWLRIEPTERGDGVEFVNKVFGGAISANYVQSAEKGIRAAMEHGVIAGCAVVDVRVTIYDGKEHPVDSKDIAFQKAGREAFKKAFSKAKPVLLEPIVTLEVTFPGQHTGDIQGDLTRRRGRVQGVDSIGDFQVLRAQIPLAELTDYASSLGSITGGQGSYSIEPAHYEVVPANLQQKVVESYNKVAKAD